jgi:hypothetical protein
VRPQRALSLNGSRPLESVVRVSARQVSCELADESVILHLDEGVYYGLNDVASRVWQLIQEPRTIGEIRDVLLSEYEIEESVCTQDLLDLLDRLKEWKLVELTDGAAPAGP